MASELFLTAQPADLEMHRDLISTPGQGGMFVGSIILHGCPGIEVIGGDGELLAAVDAAGTSMRNPSYFSGNQRQRVPLLAHSLGVASPDEEAQQGDAAAQLAVYFAERGAGVVVTSLQIRATVLLGDASRQVVNLGTWPGVVGAHPDLPGAPRIESDRDGQMVVSLDPAGAPAWRTIWFEVNGTPLPRAGSQTENSADGRRVLTCTGRIPPGAEMKAQFTRILGERTIEFTLGPWGFPDLVPHPASVCIPVEVPHAP